MAKRERNENSFCKVFYVDKKKADVVSKQMESDEVIGKLSQTFKVLGDPTRTKIIFALSQEELCVGDIATLLKISQSAISHQLRVLRDMNLVKYRKDGRVAYYSLDDEHIKKLFAEGLKHVEAG
ncbi:MAG: metalloregulator ArsR/SmtB family transcription factor [Candidatus Omnitrophica bacterium]|nr:metalloregulator ArsR/SmtB family transcription factor [Candidatus Omnitrophota bacterium]